MTPEPNAVPNPDLPPAWLFYATRTRSQREWRRELAPGRIVFWQHGLAVPPRGGPAWSRQMQRGDTVIVLAGDDIVGTAVIVVAGDYKFAGENNTRWWPLLMVDLFLQPLPRKLVEDVIGRNMISNEGAVHPVSESMLKFMAAEIAQWAPSAQPIPFGRGDAETRLAEGETLRQALARDEDIQPDAMTRALLDLTGPVEGAASVTDALPHVFNDRHDRPDLLGITSEVRAFARLAISIGIEPPLSVGVFGDWGSGKSFFMEKVRAEIERLTSPAGDAGAPERNNLHQDVAQIRFNAWHYIETNLWASLVGFIFAELDRWLQQRNVPADQVEALFDQLSTSRQLKLEAYRALIAARTEAERAKDAVVGAKLRYRKALHTPLSAADVWSATAKAFMEGLKPRDRDELKEIAASIGASDLERSAAGAAQLVRDTAGQTARGRVVLDSIVAQAGAPYGAAAIVAVMLGPAILFLLLGMFFKPSTATALHQVLASVAASLGLLVLLGRTALTHAKGQLEVLDRLRGDLEDKLLERARAEREAEADAIAKAQAAAQAVTEAERKAADASDRVAGLLREQNSQSASGRLNRFIRDKVTNGDYARHLGIVASIHRDFSQLSDLLQQSAGQADTAVQEATARTREEYLRAAQALIDQAKADKAPLTDAQCDDLLEAASDNREPPGVGRIVLYIDDLDRCPPENVVDVLQAIHMLLFFPLFVVFVAVDARWLKRSLGVRFPELIEDRSQPRRGDPVRPKPSAAAPADPRGDKDARPKPADAQDYLEKIFQIPFWVTPMSETQGQTFVEQLTKGLLEDPPSTTTLSEDFGAQGIKGTDRTDAAEDPDGVTDEAGSRGAGVAAHGATPSASDAPPAAALAAITLTTRERAALAAFGARLGGSPRRTKRYVNTYLLIKLSQLRRSANQPSAEASAWTIAALLAVVVGAREAWPALLQEVKDFGAKPPSLADFTKRLSAAQAGPDGDRLAEILAAMSKFEASYNPVAMAEFAPIVRRYAF